MRVAFVVGTTTGGTGRHVRMLAAGLVRRGHRVVVAGPRAVEEQFGFRTIGARFVEVPVSDRPHPVNDVRAVLTTRRVIGGADVVHAHGLRAGALAALALPRRRARSFREVAPGRSTGDLPSSGRPAGSPHRLDATPGGPEAGVRSGRVTDSPHSAGAMPGVPDDARPSARPSRFPGAMPGVPDDTRPSARPSRFPGAAPGGSEAGVPDDARSAGPPAGPARPAMEVGRPDDGPRRGDASDDVRERARRQDGLAPDDGAPDRTGEDAPGGGAPLLVVTLHNALTAGGFVGAVYGVLERIVARRADRVLVVSPDLGERMEALGARDVRPAVVPAPPLREPRRTPGQVRDELGAGDRPLVLAIARLAQQKGLETLLDAAAGPWRGEPPLFAIAGEGPLRGELRRRIDAGRLPVVLLGNRDDVPDLLAAATAAVWASRWEGLPLSVSEALKAGTPVIATAVGGVPGLVGDGGILVPYGDADALRAAVQKLIADPGEAARWAAAAARRGAELPGEDEAVGGALAAYIWL